MADIEELGNLGPTSCRWLRAVDIATVEDLQALGPVAAYRAVKSRQPKASLNLLWALAAGLEGKHWQELTADEKERLKRDLEG